MMKMKTLIATLALVVLGSMGKEAQISAQTDSKKVWHVMYGPAIKCPENPANKLTPEQRAAKLAELKAKDNFDVNASGEITKAHKVLANLMVLDYDKSKDEYKYTLTDIEGNTLETECRNMSMKNILKSQVAENSGFYELPEGFLCTRYVKGTIKFKNGDELGLEGDDNGRKISWFKKMYENGDFRLWAADKDQNKVEHGVLHSMRKTMEGGIVEVNLIKQGTNGMYGFKIIYDDGSVYGGKIKLPYTHYVEDNGFNRAEEMTRGRENFLSYEERNLYCAMVEQAANVSDFAFLNGILVTKDASTKVYVKGEYDEIESLTMQKQIAARMQEQKEEEAKAAAALKVRQRLTAKYGKARVDLVYKVHEGKYVPITELISVGTPIALIQDAYKEKLIGQYFVLKSTSAGGQVYTLTTGYSEHGWVVAKNGKIVSVHVY